MFTLSVEWRMGWERSLTTNLPSQEKPLRPPPTLRETHVFKELRAIKATSLHRKVTKPHKSWEKRQEEKSRGVGRGSKPTPKSHLFAVGSVRSTIFDRSSPVLDEERRAFGAAGAELANLVEAVVLKHADEHFALLRASHIEQRPAVLSHRPFLVDLLYLQQAGSERAAV